MVDQKRSKRLGLVKTFIKHVVILGLVSIFMTLSGCCGDEDMHVKIKGEHCLAIQGAVANALTRIIVAGLDELGHSG